MSDISTDIEKAFDYRGDITLTLKDGRTVVGFMSNREPKGAVRCRDPFVEMMVAGSDEKQLFRYSEITKIDFTGEDTAAGKSWEEWMAKEDAKKKAAVKA